MLYIHGFGHAHPPTEITNGFLISLNGNGPESHLIHRLGILCRRTVLPLDYIRRTLNANPWEAAAVASQTPTTLGATAARMAMERAAISPNDIDLVLGSCCTPRQTMPAEAQRIASELGIRCRAFDLFSSSVGFALLSDYLQTLQVERVPRFALCVCTATFTTVVNYANPVDAAIWGDGAAAWIVSPEPPAKGLRILHTCYGSDPRRCDTITIDRFGHFHQDGIAVGHFSIGQTVKLVRSLRQMFDLDWKNAYFVGHQSNARALDTICRIEGIPPERHLSNVSCIGNQAGAGAPASLSMNWERIEPGARLAVAVVGAGLSWGSVLLEAVG